MKSAHLSKLLIDLGLTEGEAKIYLSALSLGPTTILKLATSAELKRTTVYSLARSLMQKGLMSVEVKGFKKLFVAASPDHLETMLENKQEHLRSAMPDLASLYNLKGGESFLRFYQGLAGVKSVYNDLLKSIRPHEDYLALGNLDQWIKQDPDFFKDFIERRAKLPINIRILMQDSKLAREHKRVERNHQATIRFIPAEAALTTNLVITPQRVVIHQVIPPIFAIVIENQSIIKMHKEQFELIWNTAKEG